MKKLLLIFSLISLALFSCTDSNIVESGSTAQATLKQNSVNFIELPQISELRLMKEVVVSEIIQSKDGGDLKSEYKIDNTPFGDFVMKGLLKVPKNSFPENELLFQMTLDDQVTAASFAPSPKTFELPLELNLEYVGFDASNINYLTLGFVYVGDDGTIEKIQFEELEFRKGDLVYKIDRNGIVSINGIDNYVTKKYSKLKITKAKIYHFSRFGFVQ